MRRALLSLALLLTACGGDDEKAAYVDAATAVCERAAEKSKEIQAPAKAAEFAPYADSIVAVVEQAQQDLEALEPPADDRAQLERRVLEPFADVVEEGRQFAQKVRAAGDDQAKLLPLLSEVPDAGEVDLEYLRSYGLGTCADVIDRR